MIDKANQQSTAEIASEYHSRRGWVPIPVPIKSKVPLIAGWQNRTPADFNADEFNNCNIGVLQGKPSNNLVDVDCDHELAVQLAPDFLPQTDAVFGRRSKPRSHFLFRTTRPIETKQFRISKFNKSMIVEVRGTGGQTVFPGSVHPSGEQIEWDSDGEPTEIDPDELLDKVATLADIVRQALGVKPPEVVRQEYHPAPKALSALGADVRDRAIAYLAKLPEAISGSGGHDALLTATMRLYRDFALEPDTVLAILQEHYNPRCQPPWSDKELRHKVDEAVKLGGPRGGLLLGDSLRERACIGSAGSEPAQNQRMSTGDGQDSTPRMSADEAVATAATSVIANAVRIGGDEPETIPIPLPTILERILAKTDNWPRRANGQLFIDDAQHGLTVLEKQADFFAWCIAKVGAIEWYRHQSCPEKSEFFAYARQSVQRYLALEDAPHFPPLEGHYYRQREIKSGDGTALNRFLDFFCPETPIDRDLLLAFLATIFWGGPPGKRPGFAITSQHGRGVGKSQVPIMFGALAGGCFDFSLGEDITQVKQRLLTPAALTKRVVLMDNIKTSKMSWAEAEALITAPEISGKQMYVGEGTRPNVITWALTLNGISLARDLAQRFIVVKLARWQQPAVAEGESAPSWDEAIAEFLAKHRWDVVADLKAFFEREPVRLRECSRWGAWERAVLARLPEPEEAQKVIAERQTEVDADNEEAADIEEFIAKKLTDCGYDPVRDRVHIPVLTATAWYETVTNTKVGKTQATRVLKQAAEEEIFKRLRLNPSRAKGRGFLWIGDEARGEAHYDLEGRIATVANDEADERWERRRSRGQWGYDPA